MRKNFSAADLDDAREDALPWTPMLALPVSEKTKIRQSLSSSDLKAMGQIHSVDIYMYLFLALQTTKTLFNLREKILTFLWDQTRNNLLFGIRYIFFQIYCHNYANHCQMLLLILLSIP